MNPWFVNPSWQNFSSLFREVTAATEANTEMEKAHHMTAALYFGIAALEAFLNAKMRAHLAQAGKPEQEIYDALRKGKITSKLKKWPDELLPAPFTVSPSTLTLIEFFNEVRGDLTHPKTHGHDIYEKLDTIDPDSVIDGVAEYIARFHEAEGTRFPYWLFGWNYLNPRPDSYTIILVNDQQFSFSLQNLGFQIPAAAWAAGEAWRNQYLGTFSGYTTVRDALRSLNHCESKQPMFPFQPKLCRRWWSADHQASCGHVTDGALNQARGFRG
jgi:hypothetical protein